MSKKLFLHKPTGRILPLLNKQGSLLTMDQSDTLLWRPEDCVPAPLLDNPESTWVTSRRPTEDDAWNGKVAAWMVTGDVIFMDWDCPLLVGPWQQVPQCLRTPPNKPEYKWLARNFESLYGWLFTRKPTHEDAWLSKGDVKAKHITPPTFLKPRQLWERKGEQVGPISGADIDNWQYWNGYWWTLVEDHNRTCENCHHCLSIKFYCNVVDKTHPQYDQPGCKWESKNA